MGVLGSALLAVAMANQQFYQQPEDYANARQGLGGSANLGFGEFGSVGGNVDLQVPETGGFLTTLIYGLAALTLVNTVVAVATALWPQEAETTEKIDKNEQARRMRKSYGYRTNRFRWYPTICRKIQPIIPISS